MPGVEHISILYAPRTHRLTADWLDDSFGRPRAEDGLPSPLRRLTAAGVLLLGLLLGFPSLVRLLLGSARSAPGPATHLGQVAAVAGGAALPAVFVAPLLPTVRLPLDLGGHVAGFTAVRGVAILAYLRSLASDRGGRRAWLAGPLLIAYAGLMIAVPLQLGFTHAVPAGPRWWLLPVVWAGFAVLAYATGHLSGGAFRGDLIVSAIAVVALTAAAVAGLASGFLLLVVPLLALLLLIQAGLAVVLRRSTAPSWLIALTGSLLVAWPIATTLPIA